MAQFTVESLETLQNWMREKSIDKCPLCGSEDGFKNVVEVGRAGLKDGDADDQPEQAYGRERFGEVESIVLPAAAWVDAIRKATGEYRGGYRNKTDNVSLYRVAKALMGIMEKFHLHYAHHKVARITCGNCRYVMLLDARKIGL